MPRPQTILLVEDDLDLRRLFRTALTFCGFRVIEAGDGLHALHILDSDPPDLIILDLDLPIVSGHVVQQEVAAQAHLRSVRIVIVTGTTTGHDGMNVDCLLRKPVQPDDLIHVVRTCLASPRDSIV